MSFLMIIHLEHPKTLRAVPKLCPKFVRNIETYLKISNSIEIIGP
jgi:hypothetical protein